MATHDEHETPPPAADDGNGNGTGTGDGYGDGALYGVLAEYDTPGELVDAARKVRDAGYTEFDCFSPFPVHGIDEAMGIKRTILPVLIFCGGFLGTIGGLFLEWWMNAHNWPWIVSGKPTWSIPANVPIGFETTILMSVFTSFFGMWILNKLPQVWHPFFRLDRFARVTDDAFLLGIEARDQRFDLEATKKLLADAGAIAIEPCYLEADPARRTMPKWILAFIVSSTAFALIPFAIAAKARNSTSTEPHLHIFPDMDFQPKYKSDTACDMFPDARCNRGELPGTIARGSLQADDTLYRGLADGQWTTGFPRQLDINEAFVRRGQNRFNIYCAPCHGYDGRGQGAVPQRLAASGASWSVRNLADPAATPAKMPNGQLFNTISNGFNTMMGYAQQLPHIDRWAIVAYVRALQRSYNATIDDVPADKRGNMPAPPMPAAPAAPSSSTPSTSPASPAPATPAPATGGAP
ncbi:MAG TPA: quinol:electron acceptor oxidoreductase subunit ActD [Kofleriaceae bacterium]|nr:quinol:electron acceptor oxidoreductase subunit ActD [Kofleriaceae bacterium]